MRNRTSAAIPCRRSPVISPACYRRRRFCRRRQEKSPARSGSNRRLFVEEKFFQRFSSGAYSISSLKFKLPKLEVMPLRLVKRDASAGKRAASQMLKTFVEHLPLYH